MDCVSIKREPLEEDATLMTQGGEASQNPKSTPIKREPLSKDETVHSSPGGFTVKIEIVDGIDGVDQPHLGDESRHGPSRQDTANSSTGDEGGDLGVNATDGSPIPVAMYRVGLQSSSNIRLANRYLKSHGKLPDHVESSFERAKLKLVESGSQSTMIVCPKERKQEIISTGKSTYNCTLCPYRTAWKWSFHEHKRSHTGETPYKCSVCQYICTSKGDLNDHKKGHVEKKPYTCSLCPFTTLRKSNLNQHEQNHTIEKPYKCSFCPYKAIQKRRITVHERSHTGEKPHKCSRCSFTCSSREGLKQHGQYHMVEKHKCPLCPFITSWKGNLMVHARTHTGEKPFACSHCSYRASRKRQLEAHVLSRSCKRKGRKKIERKQPILKNMADRRAESKSSNKAMGEIPCPHIVVTLVRLKNE